MSASEGEAVAPRPGEGLDVDRLERYLAARVPDFGGPLSVRQFPAGYSNLTYLLACGGRECVLRRPPVGTRPRAGHDMAREYRVLAALAPRFPECPRPIHLCDDLDVIGAPFYLAERIRGMVLRRDYPPGLDPAPSLVRAQQVALMATLARLHAVDTTSAPLAALGHPEGYAARQVAGWAERYQRARTPDAPSAGRVCGWLAAHVPPDSALPAVIHNDYKLDNVVFDCAEPTRLLGVLDWEMATVGDRFMDLGCALAYWVEAGDSPRLLETRMLPTHLPGSLTRSEALASYEAAAGRLVPDFRFYRVFGLFRLAVIVQQIYLRFHRGETRDSRFHHLGRMARLLVEEAGEVLG